MESRQNYMELMENQIQQWEEEIGRFRKTYGGASNGIDKEFQEVMARLTYPRDMLQNHLYLLRHSNDVVWRQMKSDLDKSWKQLQTEFENLRSKFIPQ